MSDAASARVEALTAEPGVRAVLVFAAERLASRPDPRAAEPLVGVPVPRPGQVTAVLVGPGVVSSRNVPGLHAFAAMTGLAVVNTFGAKGVFRWDDPAHGGTAGLQRDDWRLAGLYDAEVVIVSGLDRAECIGLELGDRDVIDVPPSHLAFAAGGWPAPRDPPTRPPLYASLAAVAGPLYDLVGSPPWAARQLAVLGPDLVAADPGPAGFWLARTLPTTRPSSVVVPAGPNTPTGFAVAAAIVAAVDGRSATAVLAGEIDDVSQELASLAAVNDLAVTIEQWVDASDPSPPTAPTTLPIPTRQQPIDWSHQSALESIAGPITAWPQ